MQAAISVFQIILAILLIMVIIIQQKGSGLGAGFGGGGGGDTFYRTKRGAEKLLFYATIGLAVAFIVSSLIGLAL